MTFQCRSLLAGAGFALAALAPAVAAAETKGYVVNWFTLGSYDGGASDCPQGLILSTLEFYRRDFLRLGHNPRESR